MIQILVGVHLYQQLFLTMTSRENLILHTMGFVEHTFFYPSSSDFYEGGVILLTSKYSSVSHSMNRQIL